MARRVRRRHRRDGSALRRRKRDDLFFHVRFVVIDVFGGAFARLVFSDGRNGRRILARRRFAVMFEQERRLGFLARGERGRLAMRDRCVRCSMVVAALPFRDRRTLKVGLALHRERRCGFIRGLRESVDRFRRIFDGRRRRFDDGRGDTLLPHDAVAAEADEAIVLVKGRRGAESNRRKLAIAGRPEGFDARECIARSERGDETSFRVEPHVAREIDEGAADNVGMRGAERFAKRGRDEFDDVISVRAPGEARPARGRDGRRRRFGLARCFFLLISENGRRRVMRDVLRKRGGGSVLLVRLPGGRGRRLRGVAIGIGCELELRRR